MPVTRTGGTARPRSISATKPAGAAPFISDPQCRARQSCGTTWSSAAGGPAAGPAEQTTITNTRAHTLPGRIPVAAAVSVGRADTAAGAGGGGIFGDIASGPKPFYAEVLPSGGGLSANEGLESRVAALRFGCALAGLKRRCSTGAGRPAVERIQGQPARGVAGAQCPEAGGATVSQPLQPGRSMPSGRVAYQAGAGCSPESHERRCKPITWLPRSDSRYLPSDHQSGTPGADAIVSPPAPALGCQGGERGGWQAAQWKGGMTASRSHHAIIIPTGRNMVSLPASADRG